MLASRRGEEEALCAVCAEGHSVDANVIVFCERCDLAVHQLCYGIEHIPAGERPGLEVHDRATGDCCCPPTQSSSPHLQHVSWLGRRAFWEAEKQDHEVGLEVSWEAGRREGVV